MHVDATVLAPLVSLLGLITLDTALGILASIKAKTFSIDTLPQELETAVMPIIAPLGVVGAIQAMLSGTPAVIVAGMLLGRVALVLPKITADIVEKVGLLLSGPPEMPK